MDKSKNHSSPSLIGTSGDSLREAFGKSLVELGSEFKNFVVLDADVAGGTGTHHVRTNLPDRFYQCGISEQNMMSMAGGMASAGLIPFVTTFAVFQLRAVEQARLSIAYPKRNVKIVASHPGLDVGPDEASAQCLEDLAMFRGNSKHDGYITSRCNRKLQKLHEQFLSLMVPYICVLAAVQLQGLELNFEFEIGKAGYYETVMMSPLLRVVLKLARALDASDYLKQQGISARVVNMPTIKPIDDALLRKCAIETGCFVTAEDHNILGGLGGAVSESLAKNIPCPIEFIGVNDTFESGEPDEYEKIRLTGPHIAKEAAKNAIAERNREIHDKKKVAFVTGGSRGIGKAMAFV